MPKRKTHEGVQLYTDVTKKEIKKDKKALLKHMAMAGNAGMDNLQNPDYERQAMFDRHDSGIRRGTEEASLNALEGERARMMQGYDKADGQLGKSHMRAMDRMAARNVNYLDKIPHAAALARQATKERITAMKLAYDQRNGTGGGISGPSGPSGPSDGIAENDAIVAEARAQAIASLADPNIPWDAGLAAETSDYGRAYMPDPYGSSGHNMDQYDIAGARNGMSTDEIMTIRSQKGFQDGEDFWNQAVQQANQIDPATGELAFPDYTYQVALAQANDLGYQSFNNGDVSERYPDIVRLQGDASRHLFPDTNNNSAEEYDTTSRVDERIRTGMGWGGSLPPQSQGRTRNPQYRSDRTGTAPEVSVFAALERRKAAKAAEDTILRGGSLSGP